MNCLGMESNMTPVRMHIMFLQNTYLLMQKKCPRYISLPMCLTKVEILKDLTGLTPKNVNSAILISCNDIHSGHTIMHIKM